MTIRAVLTYNIMKIVLIFQIFLIYLVSAGQDNEKKNIYLLKIISKGQSDIANYEIGKMIKEMKYDEFIEINQESCKEQEVCPYIILQDYQGNIIKQFDGTVSIGRIRENIVENIKKGHLKTKRVKNGNTVHEYLTEDTQTIKMAQKRNRLMEMQEPEDWEKTAFSTRISGSPKKMSASTNEKDGDYKSEIIKEKSSKVEQKGDTKNQLRKEDHKNNQITVTISSKTLEKASQRDKQQTKSQQKGSHSVEVKGIWQWQFGYIGMIFLLLMGMKYMKREQARLQKIATDDEAESLTSQ